MSKSDVLVDVSFTTTYHITEEYTLYIFIGGAVAVGLLLILLIMVCLYKKHKKLYAEAANLRMKKVLSEE